MNWSHALLLGIGIYVHGCSMCVNEQVIVETIELALVRDDMNNHRMSKFYPFNF